MDTSKKTFAEREKPGAAAPKQPSKIMIFHDNPKELARLAKATEALGDVYPVLLGSKKDREDYCDADGRIIVSQLKDEPLNEFQAALLGNTLVASDHDLMREIARISPHCIIMPNDISEHKTPIVTNAILNFAEKTVPASPKIVLLSGECADITNTPQTTALQLQGIHLVGSHNYRALDRIVKKAVSHESAISM